MKTSKLQNFKTSKLQNFKTSKLQNFKTLIFLFSLSLFLTGCDSNDILTENELVSQKKINTVLSVKNEDEQKVVYRLLNDSEKKLLWVNKIDNELKSKNKFLQHKSKEYTPTQLSLLKEFKNDILTPIFESPDNEEYIKNIIIPRFILKMKKNFDRKEMYELFYDISIKSNLSRINLKYDDDGDGDGGSGAIKKCKCNVDSMVSCGLFSDDCEQPDSACKISRGCGFMWAYDCNGLCQYG